MVAPLLHPFHARFEGPEDQNDPIWCNCTIVNWSAPWALDPLFILLLPILVEGVDDDVSASQALGFVPIYDQLVGERVDFGMGCERLGFDPLIFERIIFYGVECVRINFIGQATLFQGEELVCPQHNVGVGSRVYGGPDTRMMGERIAIETKHCFPGVSLNLEAFCLDVSHLEVHPPVMKAQSRYIAVAIQRNISRVRWHKGVCHDAVEGSINLPWNFSQNH